MVYNAQRLNKLLAEHWRSFAGQPYFDEQGVFISAVVSAPLLLTMFVQLVCAVLQCISFLDSVMRGAPLLGCMQEKLVVVLCWISFAKVTPCAHVCLLLQ